LLGHEIKEKEKVIVDKDGKEKTVMIKKTKKEKKK
jgi:type II secretory pathway component PulC